MAKKVQWGYEGARTLSKWMRRITGVFFLILIVVVTQNHGAITETILELF